jgi:hypothetical protein
MDGEYPESLYLSYGEDGATFVRVCERCNRFVKADQEIMISDAGLHPGPNATCKACGRTRMIFVGFV